MNARNKRGRNVGVFSFPWQSCAHLILWWVGGGGGVHWHHTHSFAICLQEWWQSVKRQRNFLNYLLCVCVECVGIWALSSTSKRLVLHECCTKFLLTSVAVHHVLWLAPEPGHPRRQLLKRSRCCPRPRGPSAGQGAAPGALVKSEYPAHSIHQSAMTSASVLTQPQACSLTLSYVALTSNL